VTIDDEAWSKFAGFLGLDTPDAAAGYAMLPVERVGVRYGLFPHQRSVVRRAMARIGNGQGRTLVHMPTGAGKTRTAMHIVTKALGAQEPAVVIWLASTKELLEQAADSFLLAWPALGDREVGLHRFWGTYGEEPSGMADGLLVAGLAKLHAWRQRSPNDFLRLAARTRLVVIDEAHQAIAPTYRNLLDALAGGGEHHALLGLSATPGRSWNDVEADEQLSAFFNGSKVVLEAGDDPNPVKFLLNEGYLSQPSFSQIGYTPTRQPSAQELRRIARSSC
jgi:superfamily II DNA or RNA helicase